MIRYIDTNILVRLIANDVPAQYEQALIIVKQAQPGELHILDGVLVELLFVLEFNLQYKLERAFIIEAFQQIIIQTPQFRISYAAQQALELYGTHPKLDFMDCLLFVAANGQREQVASFDKGLLKALG